MNFLIATNRHLQRTAILLLRIITGLILFVAGAGKAAGWFGGMGMEATEAAFQSHMGLSSFWTYLSTYTEFIGGFLLIIGFFTRPAAFALFINMLVATLLVGWKNFFAGGGAFPCTLMVCSLVIVLTGPMALSVDAWLVKGKKGPDRSK